MGNYTGNSIVDYLKSTGQGSSYSDRAKLAKQYGIENYTGSAQQNTQLLGILQSGGGAGAQPPAQQQPPSGTTPNYTPEQIANIQAGRPLDYVAPDNTSSGGNSDLDRQAREAGYKSWDDYQNQLNAGNGTLTTTGTNPPSDNPPQEDNSWLLESDIFKSLPKHMQDILSTVDFGTQASPEKAAKIIEALTVASGQTNAYIGEAIRIAIEELERNIGIATDDVNSKIDKITTAIDRLNEDLATGTSDLTIEEQAELSRQKRTYEVQLEGLKENVSAKGLTFSSKRTLAENRMATENTDMVESTQRKYARELRELRERASRGEADAIQAIKDLEAGLETTTGTLIGDTESLIGTGNLPGDMPGTIGDVTGTLPGEKWQDMLDRLRGLDDFSSIF